MVSSPKDDGNSGQNTCNMSYNKSYKTRCMNCMKCFSLQGPALLVYNDAKFSEEDWRGIKMLYSSIKEFDRTKVGRFGLGFKSVFHITGMINTVYLGFRMKHLQSYKHSNLITTQIFG